VDVLWGRRHLDYGQVGVALPAPGVALALSRGLHPKSYRWVDPNEDVAAAVVGDRATLLAVADGHHGVAAAEAVIRALVTALGDDPPPELDDDGLVRLFHRVNAAALAEGDGSRTTLSLALVSGRRLCWAAFGDSPVLVAEAGHGVELNAGGGGFLGSPLATHRVDRLLLRGRGTLGTGAWVVVATDGLSNFTGPDPAGTAAEVLATTPDAATAARALVERAFAGGAGDNVALAVSAPA
jgi:serine/threonine protein phosphatase PrpC